MLGCQCRGLIAGLVEDELLQRRGEHYVKLAAARDGFQRQARELLFQPRPVAVFPAKGDVEDPLGLIHADQPDSAVRARQKQPRPIRRAQARCQLNRRYGGNSLRQIPVHCSPRFGFVSAGFVEAPLAGLGCLPVGLSMSESTRTTLAPVGGWKSTASGSHTSSTVISEIRR